MLQAIHKSMESFEIIIAECVTGSTFKHQKEPFEKIRKIMEKISIINQQKKVMPNLSTE